MNNTLSDLQNDSGDYHETLGTIMWLMSHANYHREWPLWSVDEDVVPAIILGHYKIYFSDKNTPIGFATWAWLDDCAKEQLLNNEDTLELSQWTSGTNLLFADFVAPWGHARKILSDLRTNRFPNHKAFSLRRKPNGDIKKIDYWKGINFQGTVTEDQRTLNINLLGWS